MTDTNGGPIISEPHEAIQDQLTPAARAVLDEYLNEYRQRLLAEARRSAAYDPGRAIRLADLRSAELAIWRTIDGYESAAQSKRRTFLTTTAGVFTIATIGWFAAPLILSNLTDEATKNLAVVIAALTAASVAIVSAAFSSRTRSLSSSSVEDVSDLLISVRDLERQAREVASELAEIPLDTRSLSRVLDALEAERVWSTADVSAFRDVMVLRNQFVYEQRVGSSDADDVLAAVRTIRRLGEALTRYREESASRRGQPESRSSALERQVHQALTLELGLSVARTNDSRADFLTETPLGTVAILVKSRHGREVGIEDIQKWLSLVKASPDWGTIFVTDGNLSAELVDIGSIQLDSGRAVRVVRWEGASSISRVLRAIAGVINGDVQARGVDAAKRRDRGTFEIYTDRAGRFRFRLKALNGQVVATSDAYDSRGAVRAAIEMTQLSSVAADVQDHTA